MIDSRDLIRELVELEGELHDLQDNAGQILDELNGGNEDYFEEDLKTAQGKLDDWHDEYGERYGELKVLCDKGG